MKKQVEETRKADAETLKMFGDYMEIHELTTDQVNEFQATAAPIYEAYKDKIGVDLFKAFGYEFK